MITLEQLRVSTGATEANAAKYLDAINNVLGLYQIDTPRKIAGFLSQVGHESGGLAIVVENLNYRVEALLSMFGRHRISEEDARKYGRTPDRPANQEAIANCLYGGSWGSKSLGNTEIGDGWKYRGRGLKQLTGRLNYRMCGDALGLNLIDDPDALAEPTAAALSAGWFWASRRPMGIEEAAENQDVAKMTKLINGGDIGLTQRTALFRRALEVI
jgi:putative chitinase